MSWFSYFLGCGTGLIVGLLIMIQFLKAKEVKELD
ncbi:hypothetical protein SAMN04488156_101369 [Bacillus sp. 166amftsu]|nr:hypothetical protein SAMN04488156_101369 [Bacillus sp. 166amftsu]